ncbi:MAG TPA: HAMP domain-containing sensor histidine kinase [Nocardioidaceae bacterium]|nr:HAMP domain-containing sensor histidine kinase [Nocardioidaceae bacterium]
MLRRIVLLTTGMTTLVVLAFAVPLAFLALQAVQNRSLDDATFETQNIADFLSAGRPARRQLDAYVDRANVRSEGLTAVRLPSGVVVGDPQAMVFPSSPPGVGSDDDGNGREPSGEERSELGEVSPATISDFRDGKVVEIQSHTPDGTATVRTYLTDEELDSGVWKWWALIASVSVALLGLAVMGAQLVTRRLVQPLTETAETARQLSRGDTRARAPEEGPAEVTMAAQALNGLADRIEELLTAERETVADLSHRLRTPLTALRLDVDALDDPTAAANLSQHVAALERTLTSIIHEARQPQGGGLARSCDATTVVAERVAYWTPLSEDQARRFDLELPDGVVQVRASAGDLAAAVDALMENVFAHTPEGAGITVRLTEGPTDSDDPEGPMATLEVADEGPGIPLGAGSRGRSDRGSTGLGLDIARSCAEASGGRLEIDATPAGGGLVRLRLGVA